MLRLRALRAVLLLLCIPVLMPALSQARSIEVRFEEFSRVERDPAAMSTRDRGERVGAAFDRGFGDLADTGLRRLDAADLELVFRAANASAFHAQRDRDVDMLAWAFAELEARKAAGEKHVRDVAGALVAARRFDEARELAGRYASLTGLEALPRVHGGNQTDGPSVLAVMDDGSLTRESLDLGTAAQILVVAHPLCHFSRNAVAAIEGDPALRGIFLGHSRWLAPVDRKLHVDVLRNWNTTHPIARHSIAYRRQEWPGVDSWNTPTFYFLRDGKVVARVDGWPHEGHRQELLEAAAAIGLGGDTP